MRLLESSGDFYFKFRHRLYEVVELSYSASQEKLGTLVYGNSSQFMTDAINCAKSRSSFTQWKQLLNTLLVQTSPTSFLFKVDWLEGIANSETLYFRYINGVNDVHQYLVPHVEETERLRQIFEKALPKYNIGLPVSIGVRIKDDGTIPVSIYYDVQRRSSTEIINIVTSVANAFRWQYDIQELQRKLKWLNGLWRPQYLAIGLTGNVVKISYPKVDSSTFQYLLNCFNTQSHRIDEMMLKLRLLKQSKLNYFGVSLGENGFSWKAYLALSKKLVENNFQYTLKLQV